MPAAGAFAVKERGPVEARFSGGSSDLVPLGFLGFLCLAYCVELFLTAREPNFITSHLIDWRLTGRAVAREAPGCTVLCFGDSLVKYGIAPRLIEERLGKRAYNFAMPSGAAPGNYFMLRRALESGARPTAVITDGELLPSDPRVISTLWSELLTFSECLQLASAGGQWSTCGRILLGRLLLSYRQEQGIREWILCTLTGKKHSVRPFVAVYARSGIVNRGAHFFPNGVHENLDASLASYNPAGWICHPLNLVFVQRFLELAAARRITVFWLLPPVHPVTQERRDRSGVDRPYVGLLRGLQREFPNLVVVDARHSGFDQTACFDYTHLNHRGACAFSTDVAGVVERSLRREGNSPRWVMLSGYRPAKRDDPLEDLDQARVALRSEWVGLHERADRGVAQARRQQ